ncbi:MAG: glycosyltransferase family 52, partial [Methanobrevibacter sp.]
NINFNDEIVLILTQAFFEQDISTLEEEIKIYEKFIEKFKEYNLIIKPHPRDLKNYKKIFDNINVLDKDFPIELLNLIGIK